MRRITLWIIFCSIISANYGYKGNFVVTKYPPEIIAKYFSHLKNFTGNKLGKEFPKRKLFEICHELRRSRVFTIENLPDRQHSVIANYTLRSKILKTEKQQLYTQFTDLLISDSAPHVKLPTSRCLDLAGDMRWHITPAFSPDYAFLFAVDPNFRYISSRETKSKKKQPPQLTAIVDKPAQGISGGYESDFEDEVERHLHIYRYEAQNSGKIERDPLCDLHPVIKFRLCAIAADSLYLAYYEDESYSYESDDSNNNMDDDDDDNNNNNNNNNNNGGGGDDENEDNDDDDSYYDDYHGGNEYPSRSNMSYKEMLQNYYKKSRIYKDLKYSVYPEIQSPEHSCRLPNIYLTSSDKPIKMHRKLLYCYTTISHDSNEIMKEEFYLNTDMLSNKFANLHVYRYHNWNGHTVLKTFDVPLLKHLSFYLDALKTMN